MWLVRRTYQSSTRFEKKETVKTLVTLVITTPEVDTSSNMDQIGKKIEVLDLILTTSNTQVQQTRNHARHFIQIETAVHTLPLQRRKNMSSGQFYGDKGKLRL